MLIPDYIEKRLRRPPPLDCSVVANTPPVISFGNSQTARVATLGINPSYREFEDGHMPWVFTPLADSPIETIAAVLEEQQSYFERSNYRWFNRLEVILNECGVSYFDGTAVAFDLVQWATKPVWSKLPIYVRRRLIEADKEFLEQQLAREKIELVIVNGRTVSDALARVYPVLSAEKEMIVRGNPGTANIPDMSITLGKLSTGVNLIAWNVNLQGTPGMSYGKVEELASHVGPIARSILGT